MFSETASIQKSYVNIGHHYRNTNRDRELSAGIFKQSLEARSRLGIGLSYRPGYTAWRNWSLGIDSWAPYKFKNSDSVQYDTTDKGRGETE